MARPPRLELPGVPLHVYQRGINRAACFFGDVDRLFYLRCLARFAAARGCAVHAYVLMSNHVHLLVTPPESGAVGAMLQDIGRRYVRVINTVHARSGSLWEGRFKASMVDSENYLLTCHRYIEQNPVRAGMVGQPELYAWSSHRHYAGTRTDALITEHPVFRSLGLDDCARRDAYLELCRQPIDEQTVAAIRKALHTGSALGSEAFMTGAEAKLGRSVRPPVRGRPKLLRGNCSDPFIGV